MEKDSKGKGKKRKNSRQSSQKGGLPKKTKPAGDSLSLPPAFTERPSGQDGQLSSATGDTPKQGCRQKGRKRSRADKEDRRLPKKTKTGGESPSIPPASKTEVASPGGQQTPGRKSSRHTDVCPDPAVPSTSQTSVDFCPQDTSSSEDTLSESTETEGQSDTEVLEQEPAQQPARMKMTNKGNAKQNVQALSATVNIFKGNDGLKAIGARTTANLERACPQGYVRTRGYYRALSVVTKQGTCILTGSSGSGKTTLARHLLLHFRDQGFLPLELISPDECQCVPWHKVGEDKYKLVLLVDNVLGAGNYEDELRRKWGTQLEPMRPYIDQSHVKVILASRANIYAQIRDVKGSRELLQEAPEVAVGGGDCQLTDWEKRGILERVLAFHKVKLPTQVSTEEFILACKDTVKLGYPQMCVYLATNKNALSDPVAFVQNPVQFLNDEFSQLRLNDLTSYYILILALLREGELTEHFLKDESSEAFLSRVAKMVGLSQAPGFGQIQKLAKHLCESYLEYNSQSKCFSFSHDSIWDSLFTHLCMRDFARAVQVCTWKQLLLYVRTDPKSKNKEDFVYLVPEADWPILAKRLLQELTCGDADLACSHPCLQHPDFARWLMEEFLTSENIGSLLKRMHEKVCVVTQCQITDMKNESSPSILHLGYFSTSVYEVNIFSYQSRISSLLLRRCSSLAKRILESAQFQTLSPPTQSQILTEALACALYVSDSGLVDWLLHRGARVTEECVRAACCAEQEHVGLVEKALQWEGVLSAGMLTEMARVASQMDRPRTLELVLLHLPRSESTQAELDLILTQLILFTHPRGRQCRKLFQLAHIVRALKKAGTQFRSHIDQFTAAGHFDPSALSEWLEQKVDLSVRDKGGNTLLHHAAKCGALSNVQALLDCMDSMSQRDQLVNARNRNGNTALHLAARGGHLAVVDVLLKNGGDANLTNENDETVLWMLASCKKWNVEGCTFPPGVKGAPSSFSNGTQKTKSDNTVREMLRMLVLNTHGLNHGDSDLHQASQNGHTVLVEVLVENRADVNSRDYGDKTPVHCAAERGHVEVLEVLCANRAQLDARDDQGQSALHLAAEQGHFSVVEMLMENKVNVDAQDASMRAPLHVASEGGHVEIVKCLLDKGASVNVTDKDGLQPLHLAAGGGHFPVVECLLDRGACVNAKGRCSTTPIHFAGHTSIAELLLTRKSYVDAQMHTTPLHLASNKGHTSTVELLLTHKASVDAQNSQGSTPLHLASSEGHTSTVELLLTHKASVNVQNVLGMTALHLALEKGKWDTAELLMHRGADKAVITKNGDTMLHSMAALNSEAYVWSYRHAIATDFSLVESLGDLAECQNNEGDTPIMVAVKCQNWEVLLEMLKLQCDLSVTDREGNTALHLAIMQAKGMYDFNSYGFEFLNDGMGSKTRNECVSVVVEKCAKHRNIQNREGDTPLLLAARAGNTFAMEKILKCQLDLDLTVRGKGGNSILHEIACNIPDEWCTAADGSVRQMLESLVGRCTELVNCPNDDGDTPILIAAREGRWFLLSLLLKHPLLDLSVKAKRGNTILHEVACSIPDWWCTAADGSVRQMLESLVGKCADLINCPNDDGDTPFFIAARTGTWFLSSLLLKHPLLDLSVKGKGGNTILYELVSLLCPENNDSVREALELLVKRCADLINCPNDDGDTPILTAARKGWWCLLSQLLKQKCDVRACDKRGNTLLHCLAKYTPPEKLETRARAVIGDLAETVDSANEDGNTALMLAADSGNVWMVRELLKMQCNVRLTNREGETALYRAARNGHFSVMEMLLGQDVDVSIQTKEGNTVLHALAAGEGLEYESRDNEAVREKVRSLVEKGRPTVNCSNSSGETPLYIAIERRNFLLMEILLGEDADVSTLTKRGNTILHALAAYKDLEYEYRDNEAGREMVRSVIEKGRSVINCPNSSGETPLYLAFLHSNWQVAEWLLEQVGSSADSREGGLTDKPQETTGLSLAQGGTSTPLHGLAASWNLLWKYERDEKLREKVAVWVKRFSHWVNHQDQKRDTPILFALREGNFFVAEQLLQCGADLSITDAGGGTVLHALAHMVIGECEPKLTKANKAVAVRVTELAQAAGVTPLMPNKKGKTALGLLEAYQCDIDSDWLPYLFCLWQPE